MESSLDTAPENGEALPRLRRGRAKARTGGLSGELRLRCDRVSGRSVELFVNFGGGTGHKEHACRHVYSEHFTPTVAVTFVSMITFRLERPSPD